VLCGIVGTKRVKFDVWSNDVTFANKMESTGCPDLVHISEETKKFLDDSVLCRESEEIDGHKTYFILGRKSVLNSPSEQGSVKSKKGRMELVVDSKMPKNLSANDIPSFSPLVTPTQPQAKQHQSKSLSPSPILNVRKHRLSSISETVSRFLSSSSSSAAAAAARNAASEQQKALLEARKCQNPTIVIGISEESASSNDAKRKTGTNVDESPVKKQTPTTNNSLILISNDSCRHNLNDCDKRNEKLVPYGSSYQQIPLISTSDIEASVVAAAGDDNDNGDGNGDDDDDDDDDSSVNITDLRSYISQSRCDVSPFSRTGSNRSDRPPGKYHHQRTYSQQSNSLSPFYPPQEYAFNLSPSRKDSGIKSNSRRSSIQPPFYYKNSMITTNRVSGYFTSSQSSLTPANDTQMDDIMMKHLPSPATGSFHPPPECDTLKACVQHLRKQSDLQLIKCVRDNAKSQRSYLVKPPIRKFSLSFENELMEKTFRSKAHRYESENSDFQGTSTSLGTPKINTFIDVFILTIIFSIVALSLFLLSPSIYSKEYKVWVCCFVSFSSLILTVLFLCTKQVLRRPRRTRNFSSIFGWASRYYPYNFFGSILISLPVASILINFALIDIKKFPTIQFYYGLLLFVCIIHFCNFIQLNSWTKNVLALISGMLFVVTGYNHREISKALNSNYQKEWMRSFTTKTDMIEKNLLWFSNYEIELCLDLLLILVLVFLLNREYEIGYRLSFYGNEVANQDKIKVQNMKNQADMLLHNIIPKHVAEELKNTAKYSKNHLDVGECND
jgi:adenylate cyclase 9